MCKPVVEPPFSTCLAVYRVVGNRAIFCFDVIQVPDAVRRQIDSAVGIGQNLIAYATGRELKNKLDGSLVIDSSNLPEPTRDTIQLATLAIDAGGQDAQRALPNAAALIAQQTQLAVAAAERSQWDLTLTNFAMFRCCGSMAVQTSRCQNNKRGY